MNEHSAATREWDFERSVRTSSLPIHVRPLLAGLCVACVGLPAPEGGVWQIVEKTGPSNGLQSAPFREHSLGSELTKYLSAMLPLSPRGFVKALRSQHFTCNSYGEGIEGGTNNRIPESNPITCWYIARGSIYEQNACSAGASIMVQVTFQGPGAITKLDLTEMSFSDGAAHASGLCAPL